MNLKEARYKKGLTQSHLSKLTGLPQSTISDYEKEKIKPNKQNRIIIEKILGCGLIDWPEETFNIKTPDFCEAKKLLRKLVETTILMKSDEKLKFSQLVRKYFK